MRTGLVLDDKNFELYAARAYDNRGCLDPDEFREDVDRFRCVKRLVGRYQRTGELKINLIMGHIVILSNVFGPINVARMFAVKMRASLPIIKPFLIQIGAWPERITRVAGGDIVGTDVKMDDRVIAELRKI